MHGHRQHPTPQHCRLTTLPRPNAPGWCSRLSGRAHSVGLFQTSSRRAGKGGHRDHILGHALAGGGEGRKRYDKGPDLKTVAATIELLWYPELDLSHLYTTPQWPTSTRAPPLTSGCDRQPTASFNPGWQAVQNALPSDVSASRLFPSRTSPILLRACSATSASVGLMSRCSTSSYACM